MWLSTEVTTVLDNALITMEYLYKTGTVSVHLKRLMNEQSYFEIEYSIDKIQTQIVRILSTEDDEETENQIKEEQRETEKIKFNLSMADVDDHKRQLTFCNIDLQQNMAHTKILLNEQLKLLKVIEKIYLILVKLEMSGHPNYQLKEEKYEMFDKAGKLNFVFIVQYHPLSIKNSSLINILYIYLRIHRMKLSFTKYQYWEVNFY
jgi:hypothetical protein